MGDFNAVSPEWTQIDKILHSCHYNHTSFKHYQQIRLNRGRQISNFLKDMKLTCLNRIEEGPTFVSHQSGQQESHIDLAMVGIKAIRRWNKFSIEQLEGNFEHKALVIHHTNKTSQMNRAEISLSTNSRIKYVYPTRKIRPEHFSSLEIETAKYCENWKQLTENQIVDRMNMLTNKTYESIIETQNNIKTPRPTKTEKCPVDQHTENRILQKQIKRLRVYRKIARRKIQRPSYYVDTSKSRKHKLRRKAIKMIPILRNRIKQIIDDRVQIEELKLDKRLNSSNSNLWEKIRLVNRYSDKIYEENSEIQSTNSIDTQSDLEHAINNKFPFRHIIYEPGDKNDLNYSFPMTVSRREIAQAMKEIRHKNYTDINGLRFKTFNKACTLIPKIIRTICKMSFYTATTPTICHTSRGTMIPKKDSNKYRIVHISTPLASLLEQIALHRLEFRLEQNKLLNPYQYGFCAKRGRHELITRIVELTMKHRSENKIFRRGPSTTTIISLDIEGAFDNVDQNLLIDEILSEFQYDPLKHWLTNFILNRHIIIQFNDLISRKAKIYTGVPQGSSLGPILWNLMINDIDLGITIPTKLEILA